MTGTTRKLYIRADGNTAIGYGHLRRTLTVVEALQTQQPTEVTYLMRGDSDADIVRGAGVTVELLADVDWEQLCARVRRDPAPLLIDTYSLTSTALDALHAGGLRLAVIDDGCRLSHYAADMVLDVAPAADTQPYRGLPQTRWLLGCDYFPMRRAFVERGPAAWRERVERLVVTFGGSDPDDTTAGVLETLIARDCAWPTTAILGPGYVGRAESLAADHPQIDVVRNVTDMAGVFAEADLGICAGSGVAFEAACLGIPTIQIAIAPDQRRIVAAFREAGAAFDAGWHEEFDPNVLWRYLTTVADDADRRAAMRSAAQTLIDGRGAARVAEALAALWAKSPNRETAAATDKTG